MNSRKNLHFTFIEFWVISFSFGFWILDTLYYQVPYKHYLYFYFSGRYCLQTSCDLHPCQNGGVCSLTSYGYLCSCPQGFGGPHCSRRLLPCETQPCVNGICIEDKTKTDGYRCQCHLWWIGQSLFKIDSYPSHPRNDPYEDQLCPFETLASKTLLGTTKWNYKTIIFEKFVKSIL